MRVADEENQVRVESLLEGIVSKYNTFRFLETKQRQSRRAVGRIATLCLANGPVRVESLKSDVYASAFKVLQNTASKEKDLVLKRISDSLSQLAEMRGPIAFERVIEFRDWIEIFSLQSPEVFSGFVASRWRWLLALEGRDDRDATYTHVLFHAALVALDRRSKGGARQGWKIDLIASFLDGPVFYILGGRIRKGRKSYRWWQGLSQEDKVSIAARLANLGMSRRFVEWLEDRDWKFYSGGPYSRVEVPEDVAEAAKLFFGRQTATAMAQNLIMPERFFRLQAWDDELARLLCDFEMESVGAAVGGHWPATSDWEARVNLGFQPTLLEGNQAPLLEVLRLPLGYAVGTKLFRDKCAEADLESVRSELSSAGIVEYARVARAVTPFAQLWFDLLKLAEYEKSSWQHKTELAGLRPRIASYAGENPRVWADSLCWILARAADLGGLCETVTVQLALEEPVVREALDTAASTQGPDLVRDRARGVKAVIDGSRSPNEQVLSTLLDFCARYLDGRPAFPHPLSPTSATWVGTPGIEHLLRDGVQRSCDRFGRDIREYGLRQEPALVAELVKELISAFRDADLAVRAFERGGRARVPSAIEVSERQLWQREEKTAFCDIALLLRSRVFGSLMVESVELVQVKVSKRRPLETKSRAVSDVWTIDVEQLRGLVGISQTAGYWLITGDGEVHVVPARLLQGLVLGAGKQAQKTVRVDYFQVRSMAIPLWQFLCELFLGVWLGTSTDTALAIAEGEDAANRPRHVIRIDLTFGDNEKQG